MPLVVMLNTVPALYAPPSSVVLVERALYVDQVCRRTSAVGSSSPKLCSTFSVPPVVRLKTVPPRPALYAPPLPVVP